MSWRMKINKPFNCIQASTLQDYCLRNAKPLSLKGKRNLTSFLNLKKKPTSLAKKAKANS